MLGSEKGQERMALFPSLRSGTGRVVSNSRRHRLDGKQPVGRDLRYLQVTDDHFDKATRFPTRASAEIKEKDVKASEPAIIRPARENEQTPEFPGFSGQFASLTGSTKLQIKLSVPPQGLELTAVKGLPDNGLRPEVFSCAAKSGAVDGDSVVDDADLAWVLAVWPKLSAELKAKILRVVSIALRRMEAESGLPG